jgi:hypothetical protein
MPEQPTLTQRLMSECIMLGGEIMTRQQAINLLTKEGCSKQCIDVTVFGPRATVVQESQEEEKA